MSGTSRSNDERVPAVDAASVFACMAPGEMRSLLESTDWSATALGPVRGWSDDLRAAIRTCLPSRVPMLLWWGPELVQLYNDDYTPLLGDKHPRSAGQPGAPCWAEVWDELGPLARDVMDGGGAVYGERQRLFLTRHGYTEETYWTFSYSPIETSGGGIEGVFVAATDATARVLGERRMRTLRDLGAVSTTDARTIEQACASVMSVLARSRADVPYALAYLLEEDGTGGHRAASFGLEPDSPVAPAVLRTDDEASTFWRVVETGQSDLRTGLRERCAPFFETTGAPGEAVPDAAMALPLAVGVKSRLTGVLVLGVSPYRAVDKDYRDFFELVAQQVSTALSDALAYEDELRKAEALAELDAAKTRFLQNVSHEFRTPLTLLLGPLRELLDADLGLPEEHLEGMRAARRAALRLQRLVDALLEVARAEADELHVQPEPTDLAELTGECAGMFRSAVERAGLELVVDTAELTEPVRVDREMWAKIVLNLLSNALKFTREGRITVRLRAVGDQVELTVADTGIGIAEAELPRVFDRFHQAPQTAQRSREGSGIGLSLVADLVRAHNGHVRADSVLGAGSTFTVLVPRSAEPPCPVSEVAVPFTEEARRLALSEPPPRPETPAELVAWEPATGRILLAEDDTDMRGYLVRLCREQGWAVDTAEGGADALALARKKRPDLVLADVMMPGMDGIQLVEALRADAALARVPVILLTARAGTESVAAGLRTGADDYVVKPFEPAELTARIRVHMELSRFREALITAGEERVDNLEAALETRDAIGQAVGILMIQRGIDARTAFTHLSRTSQNRNVKLRELAHRIVTAANTQATTQRVRQGDPRSEP